LVWKIFLLASTYINSVALIKSASYNQMTDSELLSQFHADGNNEWLGILLQRYTLLLLGTCMKYLKNEEAAKDAVQQIFLKAITELQKYPVTYFKSWLYMVAKNHCLMQLRNAFTMVEVGEEHTIAADDNSLAELANKDAALYSLEAALGDLQVEQKTCITLFYLQKKSYADIATATGFSLLQVKSYIQNGKRNLKILVEKKMNNQQ
jgi:RNA polymerase sigma factor (sigma-70 family)